jgi:hypothetical protein
VNGFHHDACDLCVSKVERAAAGIIEQPVHEHEGLARGSRRGEATILRETAVKTPRDEDGLAGGLIVRQAANVESRHKYKVVAAGKESQQYRQADYQSAAGCQPAPQNAAATTGVGAGGKKSQQYRQADYQWAAGCQPAPQRGADEAMLSGADLLVCLAFRSRGLAAGRGKTKADQEVRPTPNRRVSRRIPSIVMQSAAPQRRTLRLEDL